MTFRFPADVEGYSSEAECRALYDLACQTPEGSVVVELGTYKGRTAISMAMSGRWVFAVDRFQAENDFFRPLPDHGAGNFSAGDVYDNADKYGVDVTVIDAPTDEAFRYWIATNKPPISLLFIDADHEYEAVKRDFEEWSQLVVEDGVIVFDDSLWPGPMQLLMELDDWAPTPGLQVGGLTAMTRVKETANASH
jgi:hypothetical protein